MNLINQVEQLFNHWGYLLVFASSFVEITPLGFTIPGGGVLAVAGFFAVNASYSLWTIIFFGTLGAWATFLLGYTIGNHSGNWLINKLHQQKSAAYAKHLLHRHGRFILISSMLAAPIRFWVAYTAGVSRYHQGRFLVASFWAAAVWVTLWAGVGYLIGTKRGDLEAGITKMGLVSWIIVIAVAVMLFFLTKRHYAEFEEKHHSD